MNINGWTTIPFKKILTKNPEYGANSSAIKFDSEKTLRFIRITDIDDSGNLIEKGKVGINYEDGNQYILKENDILIARTGATVGKSLIFKEKFGKCAFAGYLIRFKINEEEYQIGFLKQFLQSPTYEQWIELMSREGAQPNINAKEYSLLKLPNPPKPEQKKIAEILSTWDTAIEQTKKLKEAKIKRKHSLMQRLLTGKERFAEFQDQDWKTFSMSDIFERVTRKNSKGNTNVITISAQRGFVRQDQYFNKTVASKTLDNYFLVKKGEFCYNKSYSNGYPMGAVKRSNDFEKAVVTTLYICFKFKDKSENSGDFFEQFFEFGALNRGLTKIAHEGGRAHGLLNVTPSDFFTLLIKIPPIEEQKKIAAVLNTADKEIEILDKKIKALKKQKRGLMQKLLTGKVRVKIETEEN